MITSYLFPCMIPLAILLEGCCCSSPRHPAQLASNFIHRQQVMQITHDTYTPKNPQAITVYDDNKKILMPYRIIGTAKVYKYNLIGRERKEATLATMIKKLAASIGGDGLIDMNNTNDVMQANIIAYQKILI